MKKGEATGPQKSKSLATQPQQEGEETVRRVDDRQRHRQAYGAVSTRIADQADELMTTANELPDPEDVTHVSEISLAALHSIEQRLGALRVELAQLLDLL